MTPHPPANALPTPFLARQRPANGRVLTVPTPPKPPANALPTHLKTFATIPPLTPLRWNAPLGGAIHAKLEMVVCNWAGRAWSSLGALTGCCGLISS
jgi:hypothetical protein